MKAKKTDPAHGLKFWRDGVAYGKPYRMRDLNREFGKYGAGLFGLRVCTAVMCHCLFISPDEEIGVAEMEAGG